MSETLITEILDDVDLQLIKSRLCLSLMEIKWLYFHYHHLSRSNNDYIKLCKLLLTGEDDVFSRKIYDSYFSSKEGLSFETFSSFVSVAYRGDISEKVKLSYSILKKKNDMRILLDNAMEEKIRQQKEEVLIYLFGEEEKKRKKEEEERNLGSSEEEEEGEDDDDDDDSILPYNKFEKSCERYPFLGNLLNMLPFYCSRLMEFYTNQPINQEGYLQILDSWFFGFFENWKRYYFICKGGLLSMYENSSCGVPIEVFPLFGAQVSQVHKYKDQMTYRLIFPNQRKKSSLTFRISKISWLCSILFHILEENGNQHDCFAPVRYNCNCVWYVNGKMFYERVADVLDSAKREIFMSCWWLTPQVYLRRNEGSGLSDRFDNIIKKKASEGVMIYFLVWNHPSVMGRLDCEYVASYFTEENPNIKIILHPYSKNEYGHHQKMMVIDQEVALEGGLDICLGRYDEYAHPMSDPCHLKQKWPGKDYWNPTIRTTDSVRKPYFDFIDRESEPRMGWHDVSVEVDGLAARDMSKNFIERWNNSRLELISRQSNYSQKLTIEKNIPYLILNNSQPSVYFNPHWMSSTYSEEEEENDQKKSSIRKKEIKHVTHFTSLNCDPEDDIDITGNKPIFSTPSFYDDKNNKKKKKREEFLHSCKVQVTRSLSKWSGKSDGNETSLYQSWIDAIQNSEHYILIEQQYFFTDTADHGFKNAVGSEIVKKISWAIENKRKFRVYIIFPIYPDGPFREDALVRTIMYYNSHSSIVGSKSVVEQIKSKYPDINPDEYVSVYSLKNWGKIKEKFVVEQVYPHTKMMIVDDKIAIIGSANVCDRSFMGDRDSEISSTIEDLRLVPSLMNGKKVMVPFFAHSLRMYLFNEFLGHEKYDDVRVKDPVCDETYYYFLNTARRNAEIYEEVFPFSPSNRIKSWDDVKPKEMENLTNRELDKEAIEGLLDEVKGIIIEYPKDFLAEYLWTYTNKELIFVKTEIFQ